MTQSWLTDREQETWRAFMAMHDELMLRLERSLQERSGLSRADYGVLVHLSEADGGRLRPGELCRALTWEQSRLSHQIRRMEQRGLVVRTECTEDGRGTVVELTDDGRRAIEAAAPGHVAEIRALLIDPIGPEGVDRLGALAKAVLAALAAS